MAPRRGQLIRPLLAISREETGAYCSERGLSYRDDPTNTSDVYVRNRIRHELIPLLNDLHPAASSNVLALANVLRAESEVLQEQVVRAIAARTEIPLSELRTLPYSLSRLVVEHLADQVSGQPAAGVARRIDDVLAMSSDAKLDLPGGVRAVTTGGNLRFERTPPLQR